MRLGTLSAAVAAYFLSTNSAFAYLQAGCANQQVLCCANIPSNSKFPLCKPSAQKQFMHLWRRRHRRIRWKHMRKQRQ